MRDHHHHAALEPVHRESEDPDHHEAHVGYRCIRHQLLGVRLHRSYPSRVQNPGHPKPHHHHHDRLVLHGPWEERKQEPDETVRSHLQEQGCEHHGSRRGCLDVSVGKPGVQREQRNLDRERQRKRSEQPDLLL